MSYSFENIKKSIKRHYLAVIIIVLFFIAKLVTIDYFPLGVDESYTSYIIQMGWSDMTHFTAQDVHPPVHYWFVKLLTDTVGVSLTSIRIISLVAMTLTISLVYCLSIKLFKSRGIATIGVLLLATSPFIHWLSTEARMYSLAALFVITGTHLLHAALRSKSIKKSRILFGIYGAVMGLATLTHYYSSLLVVAHIIWVIVDTILAQKTNRAAHFRKLFLRAWVAPLIFIAVIAFWLPTIVDQYVITQSRPFWLPPLRSGIFTGIFINTILNVHWLDVDNLFYVLIALVVLTFIVLGVKKYRQSTQKTKGGFWLILLSVFVPTILLFILSLPPRQSSYTERYLFATFTLLPVLVAWCSYKKPSRKHFATSIASLATLASVLLMSTSGLYSLYSAGPLADNRLRARTTNELATEAKKISPPGTPIVVDNPWIFYQVKFYEDKNYPTFFVNRIKYTDTYSALFPMDKSSRGVQRAEDALNYSASGSAVVIESNEYRLLTK